MVVVGRRLSRSLGGPLACGLDGLSLKQVKANNAMQRTGFAARRRLRALGVTNTHWSKLCISSKWKAVAFAAKCGTKSLAYPSRAACVIAQVAVARVGHNQSHGLLSIEVSSRFLPARCPSFSRQQRSHAGSAESAELRSPTNFCAPLMSFVRAQWRQAA